MLGIGRRDGTVEVKHSVKNVLATPPRNSGIGSNVQPAVGSRSTMPGAATVRDDPSGLGTRAKENNPAPTPAPAAAPPEATPELYAPGLGLAETAGSKLFVGINIKLKGVEISDCDVLVVEGQVEATVYSKGLQIAKPGTLKGTAAIDVAEILGDFSGELTARTRLVVHGTGRVSGTIRYGKLIVAEGGVISGDVRQIDASSDLLRPTTAVESDSRPFSGEATRTALDLGAKESPAWRDDGPPTFRS